MKRRPLSAAAAIVATAALMATACGGGYGDSRAGDAIPSADIHDARTPSPSADASAEPHRPDITLPSEVKDDFESWHTGDPTEDVILADAGRAQTATNYAIIKGNPDEPALAFYRQGDALVSGARWVKSFVDAGITYTGIVRYFNPTVVIYSETSAAVTFCTDETKAFNKDKKTQKVDKTPADNDSYVYYNTHLKRNRGGVWQTTELASDRGNAKCTP